MHQLIVVLLPLLGVLWSVGFFRRQARTSVWRMGNTMIGAVGLWAALTWLWKNRRDAIAVVAVVVLGCAALTFAGVWWLVPEWRLSITAPLLVAALAWYLAWDWKHTRGARLVDVLEEKRAESRVRTAVHRTHDNARVTSVRRTDDGWRAEVDHVGPVDAEAVGQTLNVGDAQLHPSSKLGRSTVVLEDRVGGWDRFTEPHLWDGPTARRGGDDIVFATDGTGAPVSIPWPGSGGRHVLIAGATGAGKSGLVRVLIAEMAHCPDVDLVLCDPKHVEFKSWRDRAFIAAGDTASGKAFDAVYAEMMRRYETMPDDQVEWTPAVGRRVVLVVDELAALTQQGAAKTRADRERKLGLILAMGRAAGIGVVDCTQRASSQVIDLDLRDNHRVRIGLGTESLQATAMVMGDSADAAPCQSIPESMPGCCYVRLDRRVTAARSLYLDHTKVRDIAAATAQHRGEMQWLSEA